MTFHFPFGQVAAGLRVGAGSVRLKVIAPLCGLVGWLGPAAGDTVAGCPGAKLPPLFTQCEYTLIASAVSCAVKGEFPSPAALPVAVSPVKVAVYVGPLTKCGLSA